MKFKVLATGGTIGSETEEDGISPREVSDRIIDEVIQDRPLRSSVHDIEFDISYPLNLLSGTNIHMNGVRPYILHTEVCSVSVLRPQIHFRSVGCKL